jgi:hypothetical protein
MTSNNGPAEALRVRGVYAAECRDAQGRLKWSSIFTNAVVAQGKNDMLDKYLAGVAYTGAFYLGLVSGIGFVAIAAGDTAAQLAGTNGWREAGGANDPAYSQTTRAAAAWAGASGGVKTMTGAVLFTFTSAGTVKGAFLATQAAKGGTAGVLFSSGLFPDGDKGVNAGDSLTVTYQLSV